MIRSGLASGVLGLGLIWAAAILLAPPAIAASRTRSDGAALAAVAVYAAGHVVCHQRADRSFRLAGQPLPVCARCTGLYLAFPLAFVLFGWRRPGAGRLRTWLLVCVAPTVLTVVIEAATGLTAAPARAAAGAMLGIGLGRLLAAALAGPARRAATPVLLH